MIINCYSFFSESDVEYVKPSSAELKSNEYATQGTSYDDIEGEVIDGIIPLQFARVTPFDKRYYPKKKYI